jgi:hypothetical protein
LNHSARKAATPIYGRHDFTQDVWERFSGRPQKANQIRGVRIANFRDQALNCPGNGAGIAGPHGVFISKNNAGMWPLFGCPQAKQIWHGSLIEGHEDPPLPMAFTQNVLVGGAQIGSAAPIGNVLNVNARETFSQCRNRCF